MRFGSLLLTLGWLGCSGESQPKSETESKLPVVYSLSYPVSYLVERLAGDRVDNTCVLPEGEDPAVWKPSTELIISMQQADLLVSNGLNYEVWVKTTALPTSKMVDASKSVTPIKSEGKTHSHGKGGAHSHGELDAHSWMNTAEYTMMAKEVSTALSGLNDDLKTQPLDELVAELTKIETFRRSILTLMTEVNFAANHPAYSYMMRDAGLTIQNFDIDPEVPLSPELQQELTVWAASHPNPVLFWEAEPNKAITDALPMFIHQFVDPLEQPVDGGYDYIKASHDNNARFEALWKKIQANTEGVAP